MLAAWLWTGYSLTEVKHSAASHEGEEYPVRGHGVTVVFSGLLLPVEVRVDHMFAGEEMSGEARV